MLLDIKWHQFVQNDEVRRLMGQPKLTAIVQSRRLTLFGHIVHCTLTGHSEGPKEIAKCHRYYL